MAKKQMVQIVNAIYNLYHLKVLGFHLAIITAYVPGPLFEEKALMLFEISVKSIGEEKTKLSV
ncbi:MAG: hypothetical protein OEZ13_04870 [Spirochaetia bacterium]|nr:hypothetical protein [Spirochaetia bacterium]